LEDVTNELLKGLPALALWKVSETGIADPDLSSTFNLNRAASGTPESQNEPWLDSRQNNRGLKLICSTGPKLTTQRSVDWP